MKFIDWLAAAIGCLAALGAAGMWLYASKIVVPDSTDNFMPAFQRVARWNARAAKFAVAAALCAAYQFARHNGWLG